jgi:hypothetical protein
VAQVCIRSHNGYQHPENTATPDQKL